jgi:hypothetical protein
VLVVRIGLHHNLFLQLINVWFVLFDTIRLALLKMLSWAVVWSHWYRVTNLRLFFYMVLIGA